MGKLIRRPDLWISLALFLLMIPAERLELFSSLENWLLGNRHIIRLNTLDPEKTQFAYDDIVIVDKSQKASNGDIVLASIDGDFTVKSLSSYKSKYRLLAANEKYKPIDINELMQFEVWGVVTGAVRKFK